MFGSVWLWRCRGVLVPSFFGTTWIARRGFSLKLMKSHSPLHLSGKRFVEFYFA